MSSETGGSDNLTTRQLLTVAKTAEAAGEVDRALGYFRALAAIEPKNPRWAFEAIRLLRSSDREQEALKALAAAMRKWPRAASRPDLVALLPELKPTEEAIRKALRDDCPPDEVLRRPLIEDDGYSDCIVAKGGRRAAVLVFTGQADRLALPLPLFDRYLAELDLSAIYLRDAQRVGYFNGVASLGDDYDETIVRLKELLVDLGAMTVHAIGNSGGGLAAISYGLDVRARTALCFAAPVALHQAAAEPDRRGDAFNARVIEHAPEARRDLRTRALASRGSTQIHLFYGEEMPADRYHAEALADVPCVTLHPIPGLAGPGALFRTAVSTGLRHLFASTFGAAGPAAAAPAGEQD